LANTRDCSKRIDREHYLSAAVLRHLDRRSGGGGIRVRGLAFADNSERETFPVSALAAKILCNHHNTMLSPLDSAVGRFFGAMEDLEAGWTDTGGLLLVNGFDLERWILKLTIGVLATGQSYRAPGLQTKLQTAGTGLLARLLEPGGLDGTRAEGLYIWRYQPRGSQDIALTMRWRGLDDLCAVDFEVDGLRLSVAISTSLAAKDGLLHRPCQVVMKSTVMTCKIKLCWAF
jgi:hypothetical protein